MVNINVTAVLRWSSFAIFFLPSKSSVKAYWGLKISHLSPHSISECLPLCECCVCVVQDKKCVKSADFLAHSGRRSSFVALFINTLLWLFNQQFRRIHRAATHTKRHQSDLLNPDFSLAMCSTLINRQGLAVWQKRKEVKEGRVHLQGAPRGPQLLLHSSNPTIIFFSASGQNEYVEGSTLQVCVRSPNE